MKFLTGLMMAAALLFTSSSRADLIYQIDIDTSSLSGSGFIELSLGGLDDAPAAIATLTSGSAAFGTVIDQFGAVTGDLTTTMQLASDLGLADIVQQVSFGGMLPLQVQFSGEWLDAISEAGITFAIKLWSESWQPLLTADAAGDMLRLELLPGGLTQIDMLSPQLQVQAVISVPAPTSGLLFLSFLVVVLLLARQSRRNVGMAASAVLA